MSAVGATLMSDEIKPDMTRKTAKTFKTKYNSDTNVHKKKSVNQLKIG